MILKALLPFTLMTLLSYAAHAPKKVLQIQPILDSNLHYEVVAEPGARELSITASFPPGTSPTLNANDDVDQFITDVEVLEGGVWKPLPWRGNNWYVPSCPSEGCYIHYRFLLAEAAASFNDCNLAKAEGDAILSTPSTWLIYPDANVNADNRSKDHSIILQVSTPPEVSFVTGLYPSNNNTNSYEASVEDISELPFSAFGKMRTHKIEVGGADITVAIMPGEFSLSDDAILNWIMKSANAVTAYYGKFPVKHALVIVCSEDGDRDCSGVTLGGSGASVMISLSKSMTKEELNEDWVMTHEFVHCAFPSVGREHHAWMEEGIATYVEPFARLRIGDLKAEKVWGDLVRGLPQGLPEDGDNGLDFTPTWGRTYWGGALFCLLADIEIHMRTNNQHGLEDALRGVLEADGNVTVTWEISRVLQQGDKVTGVPVLNELYNNMRATPVHVDLQKLWELLGIELQGDTVIFNDDAPLANVRQAITKGNGSNLNKNLSLRKN